MLVVKTWLIENSRRLFQGASSIRAMRDRLISGLNGTKGLVLWMNGMMLSREFSMP